MTIELLQQLGTLAGLLLGVVYVAGGLIVNVHLSRYGVAEYRLLRVKYLVVGLTFLFGISLGVLAVFVASALLLPVRGLGDLYVRLAISYASLLFVAILYARMGHRDRLMRLLVRILGNSEAIAYNVLLGLLCVGIALYPVSLGLSYESLALLTNSSRQAEIFTLSAVLIGLIGFWLLALYHGIYTYARPFPKGPSGLEFFGTGKLQKVRLVGDAQDFKMLDDVGIPLQAAQCTGVVGLLDETDECYLLVVTGSDGCDKAVKVQKSLVKGVAYGVTSDSSEQEQSTKKAQ